MSNSLEPPSLRSVLFRPLFAQKLRHTPLRDLLRGRLTDRLNWRGRIAEAALPAPIADLVRRVVKRTRLWRIEKTAVADELIAHFADGIAADTSAEELVRNFGDERTAAKLIRRAKRRARPMTWHLRKYLVRGVLVLAALYGIVLIRFFSGRPTVSTDYIALLNAPIERVPVDQRAWPLYRKAFLALGILGPTGKTDTTLEQSLADGQRFLCDATTTDAEWPLLTAWLDAHAEGLALARLAAEKPSFGFVLGPDGAQDDPALGWNFAKENTDLAHLPLVSVRLPQLTAARQLANVFAADARHAAARHDAKRVEADLHAMIHLAQQQDTPFLVTQLVNIGIDQFALEQLEAVLRADPGLLSDDQLIALIHDVALVGSNTASSLIDLSTERLFFYDTIQRSFTDDHHGDGRLTAEGARWLQMMQPPLRGSATTFSNDVETLTRFGAAAAISSRREVISEYDRLMESQERRFAKPLRDEDPTNEFDRAFQSRLVEIKASPVLTARFYPIAILLPSVSRAGETAERLLGRRDGIEIGIALELYRRHHGGQYPSTLHALVPMLLPRLPVDRINGEPLHFRIESGAPVIYSVGVDRDDDLGRPAAYRPAAPRADAAAEWLKGDPAKPPVDGDWILFDSRPTPSDTGANDGRHS